MMFWYLHQFSLMFNTVWFRDKYNSDTYFLEALTTDESVAASWFFFVKVTLFIKSSAKNITLFGKVLSCDTEYQPFYLFMRLNLR